MADDRPQWAEGPQRFALVSTRSTSVETIRSYLPGNYDVASTVPTLDDPETGLPCVLVRGFDRAGWTLDDYVIPRLGSGLIGAREVSAEEARCLTQ